MDLHILLMMTGLTDGSVSCVCMLTAASDCNITKTSYGNAPRRVNTREKFTNNKKSHFRKGK